MREAYMSERQVRRGEYGQITVGEWLVFVGGWKQ